MRKVYQASEGSNWIPCLIIAAGCTAILFCVIPFSHVIARPARVLEIRKASVTDLPPPAETEPPPSPPEAAPREDLTLPAPEIAEPLPLMADLDAAVGAGGILQGFGAVHGAAAEGLGSAMDSFDVSELGQRPEVISQAAPVYPAELRKARIEGSVTLVFLLTEDGRVEDPRVEQSSRPEFEKPAIDAVRRWRFKPGMKDGNPVRTHMRLPMRFRVTTT